MLPTPHQIASEVVKAQRSVLAWLDCPESVLDDIYSYARGAASAERDPIKSKVWYSLLDAIETKQDRLQER